MKKFFGKFTLCLIIMALVFSMSSCSLFLEKVQEEIGGGEGNNNTEQTVTLPNSVEASQAVIFSTQESTQRQLLSRIEAVEKVERAVVAIEVKTESSSAMGSGVIVNIDNQDDPRSQNEFYILTCHHVVDGLGEITVYVPDLNCRNFTDEDYDSKFAFKGKIEKLINTGEITLVGGDKKSDVAVLKLDVTGTGVSAADIVQAEVPVDSYSLKRGEDVFAIGNPSGKLPMNVSAGIVSYLDRETIIGSVGYMRLTQIDVQINHGSSGGGLFNMYGELVGITNGGSEVYDGINYAIPFELTTGEDNGFINIAKQLIGTKSDTNYGYITGRWALGVTISVDNISGNTVITSVTGGSNAQLAGLKEDDVIVKVEFTVNGKDFVQEIPADNTFSSCFNELQKYLKIGDSFKIEVLRSNLNTNTREQITVNITEQNIFCDTRVIQQS